MTAKQLSCAVERRSRGSLSILVGAVAITSILFRILAIVMLYVFIYIQVAYGKSPLWARWEGMHARKISFDGGANGDLQVLRELDTPKFFSKNENKQKLPK